MKNTIVNILIFILTFNVIMIIFPEGKTQKYCKITIKIFIFIYIINNIFFSGNMMLDEFLASANMNEFSYEREITLQTVDSEFIDLMNKNIYEGDEVIKDVTLNFADDLNIKASITLNKFMDFEEMEELKIKLSEIFKISTDSIVLQY